jgi:preprotein translocase subunit SecA
MASIFSKVMSIGADKELKEYKKIVQKVNDLGPKFAAMQDDELSSMTAQFRERYENGETLDDLLPEAFAAVREMSGRVLGMRHFDVQVIGAIALHKGHIAEMKTGEVKTLVSTLAGYLNAIPGKGVHIVTVNDYLAKRDSEWMGKLYKAMGMSVGLLQNGMPLDQKRPAYEADVTYGTNSEFGFDYLRDNMVVRASQRVQRGHHFAIVDEVDSILIDEARTPLIISGAGSKSASIYRDFARAVRSLVPEEDFEMDEARHTIMTTDTGLKKIEAALNINIYGDMAGELVNHLQQALKAQFMFHRDQQYVVTDGEVKIVDEFTGRIMEGRRYSEGLHQAIEAKEGVVVQEENQTLATITLQNYFRLYEKLSGMTGTAMTEDAEFREIYKLPVMQVPPNKPVARIDNDDQVYRTIDAKFDAVARDVVARHEQGQPVLVGTVTIESSERLSRALDKRGIKHEVLNAKFHEREAQIVAQAGREGAVTIATNMAGRGTDILLGGNPEMLAEDAIARLGLEDEEITQEMRDEALADAKKLCAHERENVLAAGGLCVIGTERHESRRIDNQLRGRAGRQGDPGATQFYLSLEDDLMRLFGGDRMDRISAMMQKYDLPDDEPLQAKMVTKAVEGAQRKVEEINFGMRKNVLDYDDVMNQQRQVIYAERNKVLDGKDLLAHINEVMDDTVTAGVKQFVQPGAKGGEADLEGLGRWLHDLTGSEEALSLDLDETSTYDQILAATLEFVHARYNERSERLGDQLMQDLAAQVMLRVIDTRWMSYLQEMDYLKAGIGLRGFGQRDPLVEYKHDAYQAFTMLVDAMYEDFLKTILRIDIAVAPAAAAQQPAPDALRGATFSGPREVDGDQGAARAAAPTARVTGKLQEAPKAAQDKPRTFVKAESGDPYANVGRNEPCPCGSGKKFKNCHGRN